MAWQTEARGRERKKETDTRIHHRQPDSGRRTGGKAKSGCTEETITGRSNNHCASAEDNGDAQSTLTGMKQAGLAEQ
jgi:hypothetical protein